MDKLSTKQKETYLFIINYAKTDGGRSPTLQEISEEFDISIGAASERIQTLIKKRYITKDAGARGITVTQQADITPRGDIPIIEPRGGLKLGYINLAPGFFTTDDSFCIIIYDDSMVDKGIHKGDYAIFKAQDSADNGDVVAVKIGTMIAMATFHTQGDHFIFSPAHSDMKPFIFQKNGNSFTIKGVMKGLIRRY